MRTVRLTLTRAVTRARRAMGTVAGQSDDADVAGTFTPAGTLAEGREDHAATLLPDGRVLVVGGWADDPEPLATAEVWDPATRSFTPAGTFGKAHECGETLTLLPDGRVLVIGGTIRGGLFHRDVGGGTSATAEVWDPATATAAPAGTLAERRSHYTATLLLDGRVLVVGGICGEVVATAEVWSPAE